MIHIRLSVILFLILVLNYVNAQVSTGTTAVGTNGYGSVFAPCTEILRFDNYMDATAKSANGQNFAFVLKSGDSLFFNIKNTGGTIRAATAPCIPGAAFGRTGYKSLSGSTVLFQTQNAPNNDTKFTFSNIVLKDRSGNVIPDFTLIVFDAENTGVWENITLTTTPPAVWSYYDSIAPQLSSFAKPTATGLGTSTLSWVGTPPNIYPDYLEKAFSINSPSSFGAELGNDGTSAGLQGIAIGIKGRIVALNDTLCSGSTAITLLNAPVGTTYTWTDPVINPVNSVSGATAQLTPVNSLIQSLSSTGISTVTYTVTPNSCNVPGKPFTATVVVGVNDLLPISLGRDTTYCANFSRKLSSGSANALWSTGIRAATITVNTPGIYWAMDSNACGVVVDTVRIDRITLGAILIQADKTVFCSKDTATVCAPTGYTTYKWNISNITGECLYAKQAGTYYVTVTDEHGCTAESNRLALSVYPLSPPVSIGRDTSYCTAFSRELTLGSPSTLWSTGVTASKITVNTPGIYWARDSGACGVVTDTIQIDSGSIGPVLIQSNKNIFCGRDSATVCAPSGYSKYKWNVGGATSRCIYAKQAGNYYVTVTDNNGCSVESNHLPISIYPLPSVSVVINGDTLSSFGAVSYQWIFEGVPIPGATSIVYIARKAGVYALEITDINGCTNTSNPFVINGIDDVLAENLSVYPNPSANGWHLSVGAELIGAELVMYDLGGRAVYHSEVRSRESEIRLDIPAGVYMLRLSTGVTAITRKLVKL